jgi:hypothetical protein
LTGGVAELGRWRFVPRSAAQFRRDVTRPPASEVKVLRAKIISDRAKP